jgi:hypothetical protein
VLGARTVGRLAHHAPLGDSRRERVEASNPPPACHVAGHRNG